MTDTNKIEQAVNRGKSLRNHVSRKSHDSVGNISRDPIKLLRESNKNRVERLIPLRYGRMLASPFAFYRGSACIQAHDLSTTPHSGLLQQICGDAHIMNFGGFATPERTLVFDINDFDETHQAPWEWDVKRLAASIVVAARELGFKAGATDEMVFNAVTHYRKCIAKYSEMSTLDIWYEKTTFEEILASSLYEEGRKQIEKLIKKADQRTHESLLPKMADKIDGKWILKDDPPEMFHIQGKATLISPKDKWMQLNEGKVMRDGYEKYLKTLAPSHQLLLSRFTIQDLVFKVVGVGSVGTRCMTLLLTDAHDQPLFLQVKQALPSVLSTYFPQQQFSNKQRGQEIVYGQRLMQSASDSFLGWTKGPLGYEYYFRQLRDMKVSAEIELFTELVFGRYAWLCSSVLAHAHAKAGGLSPEMSGYLGNNDDFAEAIVKYANRYADVVESDYQKFRNACRTGALKARTDTDFRADLTI